MRRAKEFYCGQLLMALEDTMEQMLWLGEQAVTVGRVANPRDLIAGIERVTPDQIRRAARLLFTVPRMRLAVVGPVPKSDAPALRAICGAA